jgi:hypothetical protein
MSERDALEFVRFVLRENPGATDFASRYDALTRAASARAFRDLGYRELAELGVSFSLSATGHLEEMIRQATIQDPT